MQKRKLEDAIRMHHGFMPETYKSVQGKIINNFRKQNQNINFTHMGDNGGADMLPMVTQLQDPCEVNGIVNTIDLTENQDDTRMNVLKAIPNFMTFLHSFTSKKVTDTTSTTNSTDERISRAKKSKLMKVCLDRTKSAL